MITRRWRRRSLERTTRDSRTSTTLLRIDAGVSARWGNPVELQQVLLNLILNACDAMSSNGAGDRRIDIIITLDAEHGAVRTSVLDCGRGIDRDQLDHIFDPFFHDKNRWTGTRARCLSLHHRRARGSAVGQQQFRPRSGVSLHDTGPLNPRTRCAIRMDAPTTRRKLQQFRI
jgi:hypothetical protein